MLYRKSYRSSLGELTMYSDGTALTALSFQGQKYSDTNARREAVELSASSEPGVERENSADAVFCKPGEEKGNGADAAFCRAGEERENSADAVFRRAGEENSADAVFRRTEKWLDIYFAGRDPGFLPPLSTKGTPFQEEVWEILKEIPYGKTVSYGEIAMRIAEKRGIKRMAAQAVGGAVGRNPIAIIVPCHRVVGSDGSLTGYGGGLDRKVELLKLEKWI